MRTSLLLAIATFILAGIACTKQTPSYTVTGILSDSTLCGKTIYLTDVNADTTIDSTLIAGNTFVFEGKQGTPILVRARIGRKSAPFILENALIKLDFSQPKNLSGSILNDAFGKLLQAEDSLDQVLDQELEKIKSTAKDDAENSTLSDDYYDNQWKPAFAGKMKEFLSLHPTNDLGVYAIQMLNYTLSKEEMDSLLASTGEYLTNRPLVKRIQDQITGYKASREGMPFVDFTIEQEDGTKVSLSDYVGKGKFTLVDFWASWCRPCRNEMPVLADIYKQYKDKGLEIVSVAVWDKPNDTQAMIKQLNMTWPQISNAQDIPASKYGFNSIPQIILFGPDGTILARDLHGEKMKEKVKEVFSKK